MKSTPIDDPFTGMTDVPWLDVVRKNVEHLRFGSVQITIHEGRVTQVESIEKTRFVAPRDGETSARR